jgi:formate dehydrogenase
MLGLQMKPYLQATKAVSKPEGEQRDEASIYLQLATASGINIFGSVIAQKFFEVVAWIHTKFSGKKYLSLPQELLLSWLLKVNGQMGFRKLLTFRHGYERPQHEENSFLGKRVFTSDRKVHLAPDIFIEQSKKLKEDFDKELNSNGQLKLITKRAVTTHNSWTHNLERMVSKGRHTNYLYIHPQDAARIGVKEDEVADVTSNTNSVRVPVKILEELMPGTVALPHGWGHQHANGLSVASKTKGVNVNLLAADGPDQLERISGMAHLTGIPVEVKKADGPQAPTWSGLNNEKK